MVSAQSSRSRGHRFPRPVQFLRHGALAALAMGAVLVAGGGVALAAPSAGASHAANQARAAARHDGGAAAAGGIISTVAGGVGGPGLATTISLASVNSPAGGGSLSDVAFAAAACTSPTPRCGR